MKSNKLTTLLYSACLAGLPLVGHSQEGWDASLNAAHYGFGDVSINNGLSLEDDFGIGGAIAYRFANPLALEFSFAQVETKLWEATTEVDHTDMRLDALFHVFESKHLSPYLALGVGYWNTEVFGIESSESSANLGLGVKIRLTERFALRLDARRLRTLDYSYEHDIHTVGITYHIGSHKSSGPQKMIIGTESAKIKDEDNDGVSDSVDRCALTPADVEVDLNGCPKDDDGDGVANHIDRCLETLKVHKVDSYGCAVVLQEPISLNIDVKFANNSDVVLSDYIANINELASFIKQYKNSQLVVEGHSDSRGSEAYNKHISQKRANKIAEMLVELGGIDRSRITAIGYGEAKPIADNASEQGRAKNRRVVAILKAQKETLQNK